MAALKMCHVKDDSKRPQSMFTSSLPAAHKGRAEVRCARHRRYHDHQKPVWLTYGTDATGGYWCLVSSPLTIRYVTDEEA